MAGGQGKWVENKLEEQLKELQIKELRRRAREQWGIPEPELDRFAAQEKDTKEEDEQPGGHRRALYDAVLKKRGGTFKPSELVSVSLRAALQLVGRTGSAQSL